MVRPIVPGAFSMAQNAHFGESIGHRGIKWATDHIADRVRQLLAPSFTQSDAAGCL